MAAEGQSPAEQGTNPALSFEVVTPDYFETLDIPVLRGRALSDRDREGSLPVVVLSQSAARHYWPKENPVGKRLLGPERRMLTVVGIVPDTRYREVRVAKPSVYFPLRQSTFPVAPMTLAIRADRPPVALVPTIRRAIQETLPGAAVSSATPFRDLFGRELEQPRLNALLLGLFALASVVLAIVGLYGVVATMVRQRTGEFGVRLALGATAPQIGALVLRRGLALAAGGVSVGLLGALVTGRLAASLLFEIDPADVPTLVSVSLLLLAVATLASLIPARASSRIDPATTLRGE
jgi:hypothetical protein